MDIAMDITMDIAVDIFDLFIFSDQENFSYTKKNGKKFDLRQN